MCTTSYFPFFFTGITQLYVYQLLKLPPGAQSEKNLKPQLPQLNQASDTAQDHLPQDQDLDQQSDQFQDLFLDLCQDLLAVLAQVQGPAQDLLNLNLR